jgi:hypothetical protein
LWYYLDAGMAMLLLFDDLPEWFTIGFLQLLFDLAQTSSQSPTTLNNAL